MYMLSIRCLTLGVVCLLLATGCSREASGVMPEANAASDDKTPVGQPQKAEGRIIKPDAGDDVIYKTRFSGFYETGLDARLKKLGAKHLVNGLHHEYLRGFDRPGRNV
jgi:hypothetical protein